MSHRISRSTSLVALLLFVGAAALSIGCVAPAEIQQGAEGEYCNDANEECRAGLECVDFVCTDPDGDTSVPDDRCDTICDRLADCDASIDDCVGKCERTTENWGDTAIDAFHTCFTEGKSCQELQDSDDPPQMCYNEIPIPEERENRCADFVQTAAIDCQADSDQREALDISCRATARTSSQSRWADTDDCVEPADSSDCSELGSCLNDVFSPDPALDL